MTGSHRTQASDHRKKFKYFLVTLALLINVIPAFTASTSAKVPTAGKMGSEQELTLEQAIELALQQNRTLRRSLLNLRSQSLSLGSLEADFDVKVIPTSAIGYNSDEDENWRVGTEISKKTSSGIVASVIPAIAGGDDGDNTDVGLALTIPLLRGLGEEFVKDEIYSSRFNLKKAHFDFYKLQDSIVLQVVNAIYESIQNQQNIEFLEKQLLLLKNHHALAKLKEKARVISAIDLYRAQIRIKEVEEELVTSNEVYRNSLDQVKDIIAIPMTGSVMVSAPIDVKELDVKEDDVIDIALHNRIEIEQGELEIKEAQRKVTIAQNNLLPQLDLELGYNKFGEQVLFDLPEESWTVSLSSNTDIFRKSEKSLFEISRISYRRKLIDFEETKELIKKQVRTALNSLTKQKQQLKIRKEKVNQARGKLKLSESKFRHGMAGNFDLLESQTQLQQAQTNLLNDTISYIVGTYTLRSKIGTLTQRPGKEASAQ